MDSGFFADIVRETLAERGCASLPGMGCLVTEQVPAFFSDKGFTINPPYQKVVFKAAGEEDKTLIERYASDNNVTVEVASEIVGSYVASLEKELRVSRAVRLPGLGYLRLTHDGNVFFVEEEGLSLFPGYDLLEPVSLRNIPALSSFDKVETPSPETAPEEVSFEPSSPEEILSEQPAIAEPSPEQPAPEDPVAETAAESDVQDVQADAAEPVRKRSRAWLWTFATILLIALVLLLLLAICGRLCPDIVDRLLYTEEELAIIRAVI